MSDPVPSAVNRALRIELANYSYGWPDRAYLDLLAENRERWNTARLCALLRLRMGERGGG